MSRKFLKALAAWAVGMTVLAAVAAGFIRISQRAVGRIESVELLPMAAQAEARGDIEQAAELYARVAELATDSADAHLGAARMLERLGRFSEALPHCTASVKHGTESAEALIQHGRLLLATGKPDAAIAAFERAAGIAPMSPEPHRGIAEAARAAGDYSRMRDALIAMAQLNAADASPEFQRWHSRRSERIAELDAQLRTSGDSASLRYEIALAQLDLGRWQEASREFESVASRSDAPADAIFWLGVFHWLNGDRDGARARYEQALAVAPNHAAALRALQRLSGP